jgi:hypothetical protein
MATLNKFFTNILLLGLAVSFITYLFGAFNFDPMVQSPFVSLSTWQGWFDINIYNILFASAAAAITGVTALLTRSGTYAIYGMLLTALGIIIKPVQDIVLAIPNAVGTWLPPEANPLAYNNGVFDSTYSGINPIIAVIKLIYIFAAFWFIIGLVIQRDIG